MQVTDLLNILYEDEWFAVINKPANFLSVPGRGEAKIDSVTYRAGIIFGEAHAVHRLDYATSGLILVAKTLESHKRLSAHFRERRVQKEYRAILRGQVIATEGVISKPLICDWPNRPRQIIHREWGKPATTRWKKLANKTKSKHTRVALFPITGRSHQLRVHMQSMSHPILGDEFYDSLCCPDDKRLHLHAYRLEFSHPFTQAWIKFVAVCPF